MTDDEIMEEMVRNGEKKTFESECTKSCTKCSLLFLYDIFSKIDMIYCTHFSLSTILTNIS